MSSKEAKDVSSAKTKLAPGSSSTVAAGSTSSAGSASGAPSSIDKYTEIKNQLTLLILRKQELTAKLNALEDSIYEKENEYFNDSTYGNIVKGFENFSKAGGGGSSNKKRIQYTDDDHIFSLSSVNYIKTLNKRQGVTMNGVNGSLGSGGGSSNTKDDLDDYEDSVEPANGGAAIRVASSGLASDRDASSNLSTPSRKRKARNLDD